MNKLNVLYMLIGISTGALAAYLFPWYVCILLYFALILLIFVNGYVSGFLQTIKLRRKNHE